MGPEGKAVHTLVIFLVRRFCSHSLNTPYEATRNARSARPILSLGVSQGTLGSALLLRKYAYRTRTSRPGSAFPTSFSSCVGRGDQLREWRLMSFLVEKLSGVGYGIGEEQ